MFRFIIVVVGTIIYVTNNRSNYTKPKKSSIKI